MAIFISVFTTGFGLEKEDLFELLLNETLTFMESDYFSVRTGRTLQQNYGGE